MHEKRIDFPRCASIIVCVLGGLSAVYILVRYFVWSLLPFLVSWSAAFALRPLTEHLHRKTRLSKRLVSFFLVFLSLLLAFSLLFIFIDRLIVEVRDFMARVGSDPTIISNAVEKINSFTSTLKEKLNVFGFFEKSGIDVNSYVSDFAEKASEAIASKIRKNCHDIAARRYIRACFYYIRILFQHRPAKHKRKNTFRRTAKMAGRARKTKGCRIRYRLKISALVFHYNAYYLRYATCRIPYNRR